MNILVINAGSSSLKYQLLNMETEQVLAKGLCERIGIHDSILNHEKAGDEKLVLKMDLPNHEVAVKEVLKLLTDTKHGVIASMDEIKAVGHRVVHGGEAFTCSCRIDEKVKKAILACAELAPLHNPANLTGIEACEKAMPHVPQVAVFDTAFHQTLDKHAYMYAVPYEYYEKYGVRRYGFHGTSHSYVSKRAAAMLGKDIKDLKIIVCHLGNGSSLSAVKYGKCVDTSMGMTPLAGVPMGTRSGDIDPAILPFLAEREKKTLAELDTELNKKSGVLGISGVSSDFRDLSAAASEGNERAQLALDMFFYNVRKYIGAYAAAMNGVDAICFTAGVGENGINERLSIIKGLEYLGVEVDEEKNKVRGKEVDVSTENAKVRVLVVPTNEELSIALDTQALL